MIIEYHQKPRYHAYTINNQLIYHDESALVLDLNKNIILSDMSYIINLVPFSDKILVALNSDGKIYCVNNETHTVSLISNRDKIIHISGVSNYILMLTANNEIY